MGEDILQEEGISAADFNKGIEGLLRTTEPDGVFNYTFFKARATFLE